MIKIEEHLFKVNNKMLFPKFAPNVSFSANKKTIRKVIKANKCLLLRYISEFDSPKKTNFWYVIKDTFIPIEEFSKNTRNQVKKGLKNCKVKQVRHEFFRENCYEIYESSLLSYNLIPVSRERFEKISSSKEERDYWIVFSKENNTPIAYSSNLIQDGTCNYTYIKYHPDYLSIYPSYALHYEMDKYYLEDNKMQFVNMGAKSLYHKTSVQDFVIQKFKYRKAYCKLNLIYNPIFGLAVKTLYPFRKIIKMLQIDKVDAILNQHEASK